MRVGIVNPLPGVLGHFERALIDNLHADSNLQAVRLDTCGSEMVDGASNIDRVRRATRFVADARRAIRATEPDCVLNLWPTFGYLEPLVWRAARVRPAIWTILHDVTPLRAQFGYWPKAVRPLQLGRVGSHGWLVHTAAAGERAGALGLGAPHVVPHPILPERAALGERPVDLLVFGQYKPARDLDLLERLGPALTASGQRARIVGRGWPQIDGWEIDDRFVRESDVAKILGSARTVLIPYRWYYQSGVAIRAMEAGTAVVGLRTPFLEDYLGPDWPGLVDSDRSDTESWLHAIEAASVLSGSMTFDRAEESQSRVAHAWSSLLLNQLARSS